MDTSIKYFGLTVNIVEQAISFAHSNQSYFCGANEFYLEIPGIAKYYVEAQTNTIYIEKSANLCMPHMVDTWLYGSVFAYLLQYHGYLVLHGSAVMYNNTAIIFSGNSGAGKSTLAAKFNSRGYPLLTDDIVAITYNNAKELVIMPGQSKVKLWSDALEHFGTPSDNLKQVLNKTSKFELPLAIHSDKPVIIGGFYELTHNDSVDCVEIEKISGIDKINLLIRNTYRYNMLSSLKSGLKIHLAQVSQLANSINICKMIRPKHKYLLDELADIIESQIKLR